MSKVILPPGKKPLATIRRVRDAADRVEDYGKLLEWLLVVNFPKPEVEKDQVFVGDYVERYADKFSETADVRFALNQSVEEVHSRHLRPHWRCRERGFSEPRRLYQRTVNVYNDIKHTNTKRDRPPKPDEIERAAEHLGVTGHGLNFLWRQSAFGSQKRGF